MKSKFLKIFSLALSFGIIISCEPNILAGGGFSKPKAQPMSADMKRATDILNGLPEAPPYTHLPTYAADGGLAYFWAWNGVKFKEDFDAFAKKYKGIKDNTTSAKQLPDSARDEFWLTVPQYGNAHLLEWLEKSMDMDRSKYLLRIDKENHLIYTVRKSGDLYLFSFYLAFINYNEPRLTRCCSVVSSDIRNIKKILLPVDKELID